MATRWWDVATYDGPMSVTPPAMGPQPKKDISSWIAAVKNQQAQAQAEAKRIADEQRREQERQRMLAEQRAKTAAAAAKLKAATPPLQVTRSGQDLTSQAPQIQQSRPQASTVTYQPPVQGPQPRPTGLDAWKPNKVLAPPRPEEKPWNPITAVNDFRKEREETWAQQQQASMDAFQKNNRENVLRQLRPAVTQYQGMREVRRDERAGDNQEVRAWLTGAAQIPAGPNEPVRKPVTPNLDADLSAPSYLTEAEKKKRAEMFAMGSPTERTDIGAINRNLERTIPGYRKAEELLVGAGTWAKNKVAQNTLSVTDAFQFLSDSWRSIGTEATTASDLYGATKKGILDTIREMGQDPTTFIAQNGGTLDLTADFAERFANNFKPALKALQESRQKPTGPLTEEQSKAWDTVSLLFNADDRVRVIDTVTNRDEALGRMQYAAGRYMAQAYAPWMQKDFDTNGLSPDAWRETNLAIAAHLGVRADSLRLQTPATVLEANRNIGDELVTGLIGLEPTDWVAPVARALRLTPKLRIIDKALDVMPESAEAARILRAGGEEARQLVGQQALQQNVIQYLSRNTRKAQAGTQADTLYRATGLLWGVAETPEDASYLVRVMKNQPDAMVTGIPKGVFSSPRLQMLAAEDGLVRFGEWMATPEFLKAQKVLAEVPDELLDAMVPTGLPGLGVAEKAQMLKDAYAVYHNAALRKMGATVDGLSPDIPMGVLDAAAVQGKQGEWRVRFTGPNGTVVQETEPMMQAQAQAMVKRTQESGKVSRNIAQKIGDQQRRILTTTSMNLRPAHWFNNGIGAWGTAYSDDAFSWANKLERDDYFQRVTGVTDPTSRLAEGAGSMQEYITGGKDSRNVFDRMNRAGSYAWGGNWEMGLPAGKSISLAEGTNYEKVFYRYHKETLQRGMDNLVNNAPDAIRNSPYGPVLLAGIKHAALQNGEAGIAKYLREIEGYQRIPFAPPASITYSADAVSKRGWDKVDNLSRTARNRQEWEAGLDSVFQEEMKQWSANVAQNPAAVGKRSFTKIDAIEDMNERLDDVAATGQRLGLSPDEVKAKQAEVKAVIEEQQTQLDEARQQLIDTAVQKGDTDSLLHTVDAHEDVFRLTAETRVKQWALVEEAMETGTTDGWILYEKKVDALWNERNAKSVERLQAAAEEVRSGASASRTPRHSLLRRLVNTDPAQIAKDRQYVKQVGDVGSEAFGRKIAAQRATIDRALAVNSFVARQAMDVETMDEVMDLYGRLRQLDTASVGKANAVKENTRLAIQYAEKPSKAQSRANGKLDAIWAEHTDASEALINAATESLARKRLGIPGNVVDLTPEQKRAVSQVMAEADAGIRQQIDALGKPTVSPAPVASTATTPTVSPTTPTTPTVAPAMTRQQLEDEQFALNAQIASKIDATMTGNAKQKAAALAEVDALNERVQAVQKQLDELPVDVPAPRPAAASTPATPAAVTPTPAQPAPTPAPASTRASTPTPQGAPAQAINELRRAMANAGIENPVDKHLVRWVNKHGELGREIKTLKEVQESEIPGLMERVRQRTAPAKRATAATSPEVEDIIKKARQGEAEMYARADEARRAAPPAQVAPKPASTLAQLEDEANSLSEDLQRLYGALQEDTGRNATRIQRDIDGTLKRMDEIQVEYDALTKPTAAAKATAPQPAAVTPPAAKAPAPQAPTVFYRGTVPGSTRRIDEPFEAARGMTFVARTEKAASNYGSSIERIEANPGAKILYEESGEFWKLIGRKRPPNGSVASALRKNETTIDVVNDTIRKAKAAGYDAVSFTMDGDIGTVLLNESAFKRGVANAPEVAKVDPTPTVAEAAPAAILPQAADVPSAQLTGDARFADPVMKQLELRGVYWDKDKKLTVKVISHPGVYDSAEKRYAVEVTNNGDRSRLPGEPLTLTEAQNVARDYVVTRSQTPTAAEVAKVDPTPTVAEAAPSTRPVMGQYPEGAPERQLDVTPSFFDTPDDTPLFSLPADEPVPDIESTLQRINRLQAERQGWMAERDALQSQWDIAAGKWSGVPSLQNLSKKMGNAGTPDFRIEGYDWQSWPKLRDFSTDLLGPEATMGDVEKFIRKYTNTNRQLANIQTEFNAFKKDGETLERAIKRVQREADPAAAAARMSKENIVAKYRVQLDEMGLGDADIAKMKRGEIVDMLFPKGLRENVSGFIADETGSINLRKLFGLEKGVDVRRAYFENSHAMQQTNAASLTAADLHAYQLKQLHQAYEELYKMGDDLFNPKMVSREEAAMFAQWARQEGVPRFRNTLAAATEAAKKGADFALIDYGGTQRGIDDVLSTIVPYHIWQTRTFFNTARRLATNPGILADYMSVERNLDRYHDRNDDRPRTEGRIPIPGTNGLMVMNPLRRFYPFYGIIPRQQWDGDAERELSTLDKIVNMGDAVGMSAMPVLQVAYQATTGRENEIRAFIPQTQMFIKALRAMGMDVPYMKPNVATRLTGLTDDWDADRIVRAVGTLQQEGQIPDDKARWLLDYVAQKTGKADGPLPEQPEGLDELFQMAEGRAMGDDAWRVLSNFFLGLGIVRQPEAERQVYQDMGTYFDQQYDPVTNPFGNKGGRQPTPATQTFFDRKFFYPDADPSIKRPGVGAATTDFWEARKPLVAEREAAINRLYASNPEATYEEEQAIRAEFDRKEAELKQRFPSADTQINGSTVKSGMHPIEGKKAIFDEFLGWFLHNYPGEPEYPGEGAPWSQIAQWRQDVGAWEAQRLGALTSTINQGGLNAFLRGRTVEDALTEKWQSEMTPAEGSVKTDRRADSRQKRANEAALLERFGKDAIVVMENYPRDGTSAEKKAYIDAHPWLPDAWEMREQQKAGAAAQSGMRPNSLQDWLGRLTGRPDEVNALFDGAKYGVEKDKNGVLVVKKPGAGTGEGTGTGGKGTGADDPLRGLKDKYYAFGKDDWDGKCAYLHSDEGAPLLAAWTEQYPDGWFVTCGQGQGRRSYGGGGGGGGYYGGGGYAPEVRAQYMNPELWDLRNLPKYYAPEDRTRFWLDEGDRIGPEQLRAWQPPR